ncbi:MAG: excinuclease ABC subunit UvrC [Nitrospirae bacterium]|nr:excinuclease ABC subunit UvrC [Nitrospirota bacterium]
MMEKLAHIPAKPGVYLFRDDRGSILYVGKAKVLKNRVRSYFQKSTGFDERKAAMVRSVADLEFTVTGNELEALILEASLIKQYKPRYNILLRDDKSYPYLKLTINEHWPRLEVVRKVQNDKARYFGPYVPAGAMWETLAFIRNQYHIPNCRYSLDTRIRPCIQYQIKKCIGPCSGEIDRDTYLQMIREVEMLLEGKNRKLIASLEKKMEGLSEEMRYEEAAIVRDRIRAIQSISESQKMVSPELGDADFIGLARHGGTAAFRLLFVRNGVMIGSRDFVLKNTAGETDAYLLRNFIEQFYAKEIFSAPAIYCSSVPEDAGVLAEWLTGMRGSRVRIIKPSRGIRKKLVNMAVENAEEVMKSRNIAASPDAVAEIAAVLGMEKAPESIGAFDISNIAGTSAVGAFVWWEHGGFAKSRYRHVKMDAVRGPDDYAMMKEMVRRTVKSLGEDGEGHEAAEERQKEKADGIVRLKSALPDLVIIDGGREHLKVAIEVLREQNLTGVTAVGLAKDPDRLFREDHEEPIALDDSRPSSLLLRKIRDEVHRFAIRYHRKLRTRKAFDSALDSIYGLGKKRRFALLDRFGSIEAIKAASVQEIAALKGFNETLAREVVAALNKQKHGKEDRG